MTKKVIEKFVELRFFIAFAFVFLYYLQSFDVFKDSFFIRTTIIGILAVPIFMLIIANLFMWVADYKRRLNSGISFLCEQSWLPQDREQILDQSRWAGVQLLVVIGLVLAIFTQADKFFLIPEKHRIPALILLLLMLVALFDAILDLEADRTISLLSAAKATLGTNEKGVILARALWKTNQFRETQNEVYNNIRAGKIPHLRYASFSSPAKNFIAFAMAIVLGVAVLMLIQLWFLLPHSVDHPRPYYLYVDAELNRPYLVNISLASTHAAQWHAETANGKELPYANLWGYDEPTRSA